ncbi:MAG: glycerol-3-phosphate dehydrogenase/oxidase, partial [Bacilli bacterium]
EWMLLPFHSGGTFGPLSTSVGLYVYDKLAGVKRKERRVMLSKSETVAREPLVRREGLKGGGYYVEYRTDDARLTIEVVKKAVECGAVALNYARVASFLYNDDKVSGAEVHDVLGNTTFTIHADHVVNATGPWVDRLREKDGTKEGKTLRLTKGVHLVFDGSVFPLRQAVYFDTPDGRMIFAIPRDGKTYVGTTDTFYSADPVAPRMTEADRTYILEAIRYMFPTVTVTAADVESSWAGVRPLIHEEGKDPSEISRRDEIWESASGLLSIAGGKLTGYRKMSEHVVDRIGARFASTGRQIGACVTRGLPMSGGDVGGSAGFDAYRKQFESDALAAEFSQTDFERLSKMYGSNFPVLLGYARDWSVESELPLNVYVQLRYAVENEMACTLVDVFYRRTGQVLFDRAKVERTYRAAAVWMGQVLGWSREEMERAQEELEVE